MYLILRMVRKHGKEEKLKNQRKGYNSDRRGRETKGRGREKGRQKVEVRRTQPGLPRRKRRGTGQNSPS
jgi:hypothetical protein